MTRAILGVLQMILVAASAGIICGLVFPSLYAWPIMLGIVLFNAYFVMIYIAYGVKQMFVELVYALWPIMPWKVRCWAIFADDRN